MTEERPKKSISLNRQITATGGLIVIIIIAGILWMLQQRTVIKTYQVGEHEVQLEVTQNAKDRIKGLSGRESIGKADGLIFIYTTPGRHGIWMKEMLFPIDIVWVGDAKIVDIAPSVQPPEFETPENELDVYYPRLDANMIIEFEAGFAEEHGLKIGDPVVLTH